MLPRLEIELVRRKSIEPECHFNDVFDIMAYQEMNPSCPAFICLISDTIFDLQSIIVREVFEAACGAALPLPRAPLPLPRPLPRPSLLPLMEDVSGFVPAEYIFSLLERKQ